MALGKFMAEALGEGAFLGILKNAWKWAGRIIGFLGVGEAAGKSVGEELKKRILDPKSWDDEHYFALDLAEVAGDRDKKIMIEKAMKRAQQLDDSNGTYYARNFRLIVTFHDKDDCVKGTPGSPAVPAIPGTAARPAVPARPAVAATLTSAAIPARPARPAVSATPGTPGKPAVPATPPSKRPGIIILQDLADSCATSREVFLRIVAAGMMQDGSTSMEKFLKFGKTTLWPFLTARADDIQTAAVSISSSLESLATKSEEEYESRLWWKKIPIIGGFFK